MMMMMMENKNKQKKKKIRPACHTATTIYNINFFLCQSSFLFVWFVNTFLVWVWWFLVWFLFLAENFYLRKRKPVKIKLMMIKLMDKKCQCAIYGFLLLLLLFICG